MDSIVVFHIRAGHDSWVIGDQPYVSLHFPGAESYAKSCRRLTGSCSGRGGEWLIMTERRGRRTAQLPVVVNRPHRVTRRYTDGRARL